MESLPRQILSSLPPAPESPLQDSPTVGPRFPKCGKPTVFYVWQRQHRPNSLIETGIVPRGVQTEGDGLIWIVDQQSRFLQFQTIEHGEPRSASCNVCQVRFRVTPKPGERTDDVLLRLRAEFEAHVCYKQNKRPPHKTDSERVTPYSAITRSKSFPFKPRTKTPR